MTELVEFFGLYGTLPSRVDKNALNKKLFFLGAIALVALTLNGCVTPNAAYYRGYKDCAGKVSGVFEYIELLEKEQNHCFTKAYYEDQIRNLQMDNAALRSSNHFILNLKVNKKCDPVDTRDDKGVPTEMECIAEQVARKVDSEVPYHGR